MTYDNRGRQAMDTQDTQSDNSSAADSVEITPERQLASFPVSKLRSLTQKISSPRWIVPVLADQELECLLNYAIDLTIAGIDHDSEHCLQFYRDAMVTSFAKILTDEAVNSWKYQIHRCILISCGKLVHLIAIHMKRDNPFLLELLSMVLDPENKFNTYNAGRQSECFGPEGIWGILDENQIYAKVPADPKSPKGWLVDLINRFGQFGGFDNLLERFNCGLALMRNQSSENLNSINSVSRQSLNDDNSKQRPSIMTSSATSSTLNSIIIDNNKLSLALINALLLPFGKCCELLTISTIEKYFKPIWEVVLELLDSLSDDELKREAKPEGRNDYVNGIVKASRCLASRLPNQENLIKDLETFRLKMILRLLQVSSFNGKMNALNEINKILTSVSYYSHRTPQMSVSMPDDEMDWLTAERMANWIKDTNVLGIVLKDSLHQPQYVEKLEKILRFLIKEKSLTLEDLDAVWRAQAGKHEAIVKNVHDLLARLAWDFSPEQLDHLFVCFQASMTTANKRQRERLLELIRRLAEDDKNGVMANKVLKLFWTLAHSAEIPPEVLDQTLAAHVKILDYSCSQERDAQKSIWLDKCVEEVKAGENWVLPALRLIREICCLYEASPNHAPRQHINRQQVIERLQSSHTLVILVTNSLTSYMEKIRNMIRDNPELQPNSIMIDNRYPHSQQIQERLDFLKFLLKDGQLWLCADQANQIWGCLGINAVFPSDREECFRWFGKLMGEDPDLDPGINKEFFENNLLKLDPQLLTESGIKCFERFFKAVNSNEDKLKAIRRGYILDNEDLIGKDYLWRVITTGGEEIANKAIELLKEVSTALSPRLQENISEFHEIFIKECCDRLKTHFDNIVILSKSLDNTITPEAKDAKLRHIEAEKMCRILRVLQEYIKECDRTFIGDRIDLPLNRASRGKHMVLYVRIENTGRPIDDIEITTHSNEAVVTFKKNLLKRIKGASSANIKVDFYYNNGNVIEIADDRCALSQYSLRDKMILTAKLTPVGTGLASSPDSSSDSSTGSPPRPCPDMKKPDPESHLPGVIISKKPQYTEFFLKLYQLGSELQHGHLRDCARTLLHLLPLDNFTVNQLRFMCQTKVEELYDHQQTSQQLQSPTPEKLFLHATPAQVLYNLEVLHAILMPAIEPYADKTLQMQSIWLHSGIAHFTLELLTKNNFLPNADMHTRRAAFQCVLRLAKMFLYIVGCVLSRVGDEPPLSNQECKGRSQVEILKQVLSSMQSSSENTLGSVSSKLAESLAAEMLSGGQEGGRSRMLFSSALQWSCPDLSTIKALLQLSWAASTGNLQLLGTKSDFCNETSMPDPLDFLVCREAFEVLTISLVLNPNANDSLSKDEIWSKFITSVVIFNPSRHIRQVAAEQLFLCCTYCAADRKPFEIMIALLVSILQNLVPQYPSSCAEFFQLFCRTLNYGCVWNWPLNNGERLLTQEITWLQSIRQNVRKTGAIHVHEDLLEGHLCLTKELMFFLLPELKKQLSELIVELIADFLFPASQQYYHFRKTGEIIDYNSPPPVCRSSHTIAAGCDLVVALCQGCVQNMKMLVNMIVDMFCSDNEALREWEYLPPVGPRPPSGFCGLKNAGATCYMNSVLQQLYMVPAIRLGILSADGAATDMEEDFSGDIDNSIDLHGNMDDDGCRKNYHVDILKYVQAIFAHLGHSALQFYVPRGLWSHFRLQGEPVNLREQQDAVEFFMSLFESLDEGLKALGHNQLMGATLGGSFSDQKICQECPHRYSKEEPFSVFSVDIRNHSSLTESLEQYVKGELLEGADAYHCDKCDKKVVTIKRLCVRKLPPVLAIQLKRFEYDYERVCAIKFNDYFEFPRLLDMEPYTVSGLAKVDGEVIDIDENIDVQSPTTKYELTGIVVHSGQASGGHYFSFILHRDTFTGKEQWYKFDDGEVSECKMHEYEEMKAQCFGGDYMGEVYDNNLKRMQYRRQKRWWNAYMLFYTRCDQKTIKTHHCVEQLSLAESTNYILPMPAPIEKSVRSQNIRFLHSRSLFSTEFFAFIRNLVNCSAPPMRIEKLNSHLEELSLLGMQLAAQFLFHCGFRTKKALRGPAIDWYEDLNIPVHLWYEALTLHIRQSPIVRRWFAHNVLLNSPSRISEYILVAPLPEVRTAFVKLLVFFCHFAISDEPIPSYDGNNLCEQVLISVLQLLKSEVSDHGKHLPHYFSLFSLYAGLGLQEKNQLIRLNVPAIFMQVALDDGPGPPIKYQYPELNKLHQVVSSLVRHSDISSRCQNANNGQRVLPNPYRDSEVPIESLTPLSPEAIEYLFEKTSYIKKLIEDTSVREESLKLLQYCCWENPHFSRSVLTELLWQCGFAYWHDMRHHTDLLLHILLIEDSWQSHRIHNALIGVADEREGLLEIIQKAKGQYQKRAYQIIKCLVQLFQKSEIAAAMLNRDPRVTRAWTAAVEWLQEELERHRGISQYNYSSWSPPAQSNDNTTGFMLERSASAKNTLTLAFDLCPEEEQEENNESDIEQVDESKPNSINNEQNAVNSDPLFAEVPSTQSSPVVGISETTTNLISLDFCEPNINGNLSSSLRKMRLSTNQPTPSIDNCGEPDQRIVQQTTQINVKTTTTVTSNVVSPVIATNMDQT